MERLNDLVESIREGAEDSRSTIYRKNMGRKEVFSTTEVDQLVEDTKELEQLLESSCLIIPRNLGEENVLKSIAIMCKEKYGLEVQYGRL